MIHLQDRKKIWEQISDLSEFSLAIDDFRVANLIYISLRHGIYNLFPSISDSAPPKTKNQNTYW